MARSSTALPSSMAGKPSTDHALEDEYSVKPPAAKPSPTAANVAMSARQPSYSGPGICADDLPAGNEEVNPRAPISIPFWPPKLKQAQAVSTTRASTLQTTCKAVRRFCCCGGDASVSPILNTSC